MSTNKNKTQTKDEELKNAENQTPEKENSELENNKSQSEEQPDDEHQEQEQESADKETEKTDKGDDFEKKYNEVNDKYLRLYSDFENFRRRSAREKMELIDNAGGGVIKEILPVLDDFERALSAENDKEEKASESFKEGITLVYQKLMKTLQAKGLKPMENIGKEFDSDREEAVAKIPAPKKKMKGKVIDVVEKGYYLNDKILRHAKVVVGE